MYDGNPQIVVSHPDQIQVVESFPEPWLPDRPVRSRRRIESPWPRTMSAISLTLTTIHTPMMNQRRKSHGTNWTRWPPRSGS